ncbi:sugar ABC transporter permease [Deinococcus soli (ex Cha et al. 2016)]|uniref:Multiple sugar transport system permease protein n=2 Tax=Deinococcus soli (ex Cha et al. 2016) TaxID=1309411 RepID=A0AAE4BNX6_9DEIO|nr:sugar ABC transporter permease [Deinococcus soli (ex Cha et al. 2016)]MDR6219186.1 multiple sugar transport system permease protein [Deinococcus soli (ex Cha et al. 2016)]MDR6329435.1 multiple sugar transport system permease protein [Deinococcus soli (ex Cha et al. 2016)]MDR6752095.1 multiple sugar transport system permease protein [Deinococcus soli (ex Cha et al. 2016)]
MSQRAAPRTWSYTRFQQRFAPYLFVSPFFILFAVFGLFPLIFSLFLAFHLWSPLDGVGNWKFVGFENFQLALGPTDMFWRSLKNTVWIGLLSGIPQHLVALPLAFIIHHSLRRFQGTFSTILFLPYITNAVAIAIVFATLYSERLGILNYLGGQLGLDPVRWLGDPNMVPYSVAAVVFWRYVGWNTVLYLSGLQAISEDVYEAATVDGANGWQKFWHITLPLLRPMMFYAFTLTIVGSMQLFEEPFMLLNDGGGSGGAGLTSAMHIFNTAFRDLDMGYASAMSWLLFLAIFALSMLNNYLFSRDGGRR